MLGFNSFSLCQVLLSQYDSHCGSLDSFLAGACYSNTAHSFCLFGLLFSSPEIQSAVSHWWNIPTQALFYCVSLGLFIPAPQMSTVLPSVTPALRQAWIPTDRGSIRAPSSYVTLSGNLQESHRERKGEDRKETRVYRKIRQQSWQTAVR